MTESTDQTEATEELADMSVTDLALRIDRAMRRHGDRRYENALAQAEGGQRHHDTEPLRQEVRAMTRELAGRVEAEQVLRDQAENRASTLLAERDRLAMLVPTEAERVEYVKAGLRLALDLATAQANITAARQAAASPFAVPADHGRDNYRDLLAAELAAMDALTAHLAAR